MQSDSVEQTAELGARLAEVSRPGEVILLDGDLGTGKTVFAKGFIGSMSGGEGRTVRSPTFIYIHHYPTIPPVHHIDLYRLPKDSNLKEMGLWDHIGDSDFVLIEWPNHVEKWRFSLLTHVKFEMVGDNSRRLSIFRP